MLSVGGQLVNLDCLEGKALVVVRVLREALAVVDVGRQAALIVAVAARFDLTKTSAPKQRLP